MKAVGIILAGGKNLKMRELSMTRALAAMPVAGAFRCIDFTLSNMTNSQIKKVAVLSQYNARSLNEHLASSKWWNFGRKQGGLYVFTPTLTPDNSWFYRGTADAMHQNLDWLKRCNEPYVVISNGDAVYKLNYEELLFYHIEKDADITIAVKKLPGEDVSRFGVVKMNDDNRIISFIEKPMVTDLDTVSAGIYVLRRDFLIELLESAAEEDKYSFVSDIIVRCINSKKIYGYKMHDYWSNISTVESYYKTNMDFLDPKIRSYFFKQEPYIYSKVSDLPPAKFNEGSDVKNSLVASGSIINGKVENSVLFKHVFVGKNCTIKNSIVLNEVYIGDNTYLENCIVDSRGNIEPNMRIVGGREINIVVGKSTRYGSYMN